MKHIVLISGFTEDRHAMTGTRKIYRELVDEYGYDVTLCELNDDFELLADSLMRQGVTELLVCAYSWGCGNGLKELSKHFVGPIKAVLCDPVYRSKYPWMRWRALTNKFFEPTIKYPENVTVVRWFNQTVNKPSGHAVKAGELIATQPTTLYVKHSEIDDSEEYKQSVFIAAKIFLLPRGAKEASL